MALDEPKDEDEVVAVDGFRVVAEKKLLDEFGGVTVDYMKTGWSEGFRITPGKPSTSNCGSCSC